MNYHDLGKGDIAILETRDGQAIEFTVLGVLEERFAVCYSQATGEHVVTDLHAQPLTDTAQAQAALDRFLARECPER